MIRKTTLLIMIFALAFGLAGCHFVRHLASQVDFPSSGDNFPVSENGFPVGIRHDDDRVIRLGMSRSEVEEVLGPVDLRPEHVAIVGHLELVDIYYDGGGIIELVYNNDGKIIAIFLTETDSWAIASNIRPGLVDKTGMVLNRAFYNFEQIDWLPLTYAEFDQNGDVIYGVEVVFGDLFEIYAPVSTISIANIPEFENRELR